MAKARDLEGNWLRQMAEVLPWAPPKGISSCQDSFPGKVLYNMNECMYLHNTAGASKASSKWVGKTKNYSYGSKKWVGKHSFSIMIRQKSGWARAHPAHPAPTPLLCNFWKHKFSNFSSENLKTHQPS